VGSFQEIYKQCSIPPCLSLYLIEIKTNASSDKLASSDTSEFAMASCFPKDLAIA
jgi:hypothetical protein